MKKLDDYRSSTTSWKTETSDVFSTDEVGINESPVPENTRCELDDILKEADQLIYDPDDVPILEIEAAENSLLEDIRQYFETDGEESSLIEEIRRHFGIDSNEDCLTEDAKCSFGADSEENSLPEDIRQYLRIDTEVSTSIEDIKSGFGTDEGENNSVEENTLKRDARDLLNNIFMKIGISFNEETVPEEIPVNLSNEKNEKKSSFLKKWKSIEFQSPLYSTNLTRNDTKIETGVYIDEPCTSVESMEKKKSECSVTKEKGISYEKTRGTVSCSNIPHVIIPKNSVEELFPPFSAKNSGFSCKQCTELLDEDDVRLDSNRESCRNEFFGADKHFKNKTSKYCVTQNQKTEQNEETIESKSDTSSSASYKVAVSRKTAEKPCHFLKVNFPEKTYVSLPFDPIDSKEDIEKTCHRSKGKTSPKSEILFPTYFSVSNSREPIQEISHSFNPTPPKVTNTKEFLTKDDHFDWEKWLEAYDSDADVLPPIPKFRAIKRDRHPKSFCSRFLSLFPFCFCISSGRKKKKM